MSILQFFLAPLQRLAFYSHACKTNFQQTKPVIGMNYVCVFVCAYVYVCITWVDRNGGKF